MMQNVVAHQRKKLPIFARIESITKHGDRVWTGLNIGMSLVVVLLMLLVGILLWQDSASSRQAFGFSFLSPFTEAAWNPVENNFAAWPFIYGTFITSLVALIIAVPLSIGIAIFLSELCPPWLRTPLNLLVELLSAIPSVVYGLWGIFVFLPLVITPLGQFLGSTLGSVPLLGSLFSGPISASGSSRLAAGVILAIMILPTIAAVTRDVLLAIPSSQREASLALGATRWETISRVLLPYGISGILGAVILGLGRALGETMAVTMVIGNSIGASASLLKPGYTMSSVIANEFAEAVSPMHSQALIEVALILFLMTLILNIIARLLIWSVARKSTSAVRV
ncbi:MAG TPA: phosphate ABC transporter permease subunit PstC [Anaerolineaceae bacterium]|jgi:phosphate transport system permease protein|nr:phosphate ABC transporter permease subunit PstC [Anaerolineaceae bacterium]